VRKVIAAGVPPVTALQIATINTARHYRLRNYGAIAPRYWADFVVFDDWQNFTVRQVYKKGTLVAENGIYLGENPLLTPLPRSTMNVRYDAARDFVVKAQGAAKIKVIEIVPNQIVTKQLIATPKVADGQIVVDVERDILKLVVVERHRATGRVGVGFVRGFELKRGALASSVAHDAHNVVVVGVNDADIVCAIKRVQELQGGLVAVADGNVMAELGLPIAGLVSDKPLEEVIRLMAGLDEAAHSLGSDLHAPFMTLSFLSLSPIPELKLTDQGLINATKMERTSLFV
jgi:adenine deaminase